MKTISVVLFLVCVFGQILANEEELPPFGLPLLRDIPDKFTLKAENRIFGGLEVAPHSLPYQVGFYSYTEFNTTAFCGGSIISKSYILTAAHCLWKKARVEVILGGHDLQNPNEKQIKIEVPSKNFRIHEKFDYTVEYDIAVIKLQNPIEFNDAIQPISLPPFSDKAVNFLGSTATVSGWGRTEASSSVSQVLLKTEEKIISNDLCVYFYGDKVKEDLHICTAGENSRGPCSGDSGGPLVIGSKQIGIVSFGPHWIVGCFNFDFPAGYTRVTEHLEWIRSHTNLNIAKE